MKPTMSLEYLVAKMEQFAAVNNGPIDCNKFDWEIGKSIRQGDVLITRVAAADNEGYAAASNQLAPGQTVGSRHTVALRAGVSVMKSAKRKTPLNLDVQRGPQIVVETTLDVNHPTHDDILNAPAGFYDVDYQIDPKTQERALD